MKHYAHKTGTIINGYSNNEEHYFYENTTKRQMFLIIEQMAEMLKCENQNWVERANEELQTLKTNGIK